MNTATDSYQSALERTSPTLLRGICRQLDLKTRARVAPKLAQEIEQFLSSQEDLSVSLTDLQRDWFKSIPFLSYLPETGWNLSLVYNFLGFVGARAPETLLRSLLAHGVIVLGGGTRAIQMAAEWDQAISGWERLSWLVFAHPGLKRHRPVLADQEGSELPSGCVPVRADGWEILLRSSVLWQLLQDAPVRLTQNRKPYKRDWERLNSDPVLQAAFDDEPATILNLLQLVTAVSVELGLSEWDKPSGRLTSCSLEGWNGDREQLQKRAANAILETPYWKEWPQSSNPDFDADWHLPARRVGTLLMLAGVKSDRWIELTDLAHAIHARDAYWNVPVHSKPLAVPMGRSGMEQPAQRTEDEPVAWTRHLVLGALYHAGVIEYARCEGKTWLRLTPFGRSIAEDKPFSFEAPDETPCLFVQPNHEIVAYRQMFSPRTLKELSQFCSWRQLGVALGLDITAASVMRASKLGVSADRMIQSLRTYAQRGVPTNIEDSIRTWSKQSEKLALYEKCAILEFESAERLDQARERGLDGICLGDRLLLVTDVVPFEFLRLSSSRDYRHPESPNIEILESGTCLSVDNNASDLLLQCELPRFAERSEQLDRYEITPASIVGAERTGWSPNQIRFWFRTRLGCEPPPAVELLLHGFEDSTVEFSRPVLILLPNETVADGIMQHQATRPFIQERIGKCAISVRPELVGGFETTLRELGFRV